MKFGFIASRAQKSFEALNLKAREMGHEVDHIPLESLPLTYQGVKEFALELSDKYDALHYYGGIADPVGFYFGLVCEEFNVPLLNNRSKIHPMVHDKMYQILTLTKANLPVPKTEFSKNPNLESLVNKLGSPLIAKRARGTQGAHVHMISTAEELAQIETASNYLFQEFIPHKNDIRVLVLNGVAVCAYRRVPGEGDFRANLARGGHAEKLFGEEEKNIVFTLAEAAVKAIPHDLAGIDIIKSEKDGKYRLIEVNTNPSWYGIYEATETHFEDSLIKAYIELAKRTS